MWWGAHAHVWAWPEDHFGCYTSDTTLPTVFETGTLTGLEHAQSAQLGSQKDPGIHSRAGSTSVHHGTWLVV